LSSNDDCNARRHPSARMQLDEYYTLMAGDTEVDYMVVRGYVNNRRCNGDDEIAIEEWVVSGVECPIPGCFTNLLLVHLMHYIRRGNGWALLNTESFKAQWNSSLRQWEPLVFTSCWETSLSNEGIYGHIDQVYLLANGNRLPLLFREPKCSSSIMVYNPAIGQCVCPPGFVFDPIDCCVPEDPGEPFFDFTPNSTTIFRVRNECENNPRIPSGTWRTTYFVRVRTDSNGIIDVHYSTTNGTWRYKWTNDSFIKGPVPFRARNFSEKGNPGRLEAMGSQLWLLDTTDGTIKAFPTAGATSLGGDDYPGVWMVHTYYNVDAVEPIQDYSGVWTTRVTRVVGSSLIPVAVYVAQPPSIPPAPLPDDECRLIKHTAKAKVKFIGLSSTIEILSNVECQRVPRIGQSFQVLAELIGIDSVSFGPFSVTRSDEGSCFGC
jgi:hypothetical protein